MKFIAAILLVNMVIMVIMVNISPASAQGVEVLAGNFKPLGAPVPVSTDDIAMFAGGCFWCMESEFEDLPGVSDVTSGYAGESEGIRKKPPTYEEVSRGDSGFLEAVAISYDPTVVPYQKLLDIFWSNVDPFDEEGQFCDKGSQYAAAIFVKTPEEEKLARASIAKIEKKFKRKVATQILPQRAFYEAEDYHQDYATRNTLRYNMYRKGCGRDARLDELRSGDEMRMND
ncbi:MAG TPA: peptide-methionine (S)-S-oxide reductase MsrA [Micavibrio sp.]|nr:peptide-methionine (S)-S-oxide reductase MsrA [Micavibrio sp.]